MAGTVMQAEMAQQPEVLASLVARREEVAGLVQRPTAGTTVVARGSSDHAGVYGRYLIELASGRPAGLAAPSLHTLYDAHTDHAGYLAVAVSQSGRTPEIVTTLERMQASGARGLAITNDGASPLARAAHAAISLGAGTEQAVPATKTVTATLAALALVAAALGQVPFSEAELDALPGQVAEVLADDATPARVAEELAGASRLITAGRGLLFGAALETALKLKETTMVSAEGCSAADLRHGPIAVVERGFPVLALLAPGPGHADMADLVGDLRSRGADVYTVAPEGDLPLPPAAPEALQPVLAVVRAQQLALHLARARGLDPDAPAGLNKITVT